jgi:hypothetical protein
MVFFTLITLIFTSFVNAQVTIEGTLLEKGTRKPLADVSVFILPHKLKATTTSTGSYKFENVPAGSCQLIVNLTGYIKLEKNENCQETKNQQLFLEKKFYTSFQTTVTGKATRRDDQAQALTQEEFIKAPGSFGGDPVRAAQNLPGVGQSGANAQVIVQGAGPDDTSYLINGHRVPIIFHFGGLSSVIIPEAVDRVELLPSGYGPEYSLALGGVVGLTTKNPRNDRLHGMAFVDLFNAGGLLEGPIDEKSSFLVAGRYSYIGQVLQKVAESNDNLELTAAPTYYDITSIYTREINEKNIFKTTFVASRDELELIFNRSINNDPGLTGNFYNRTQFFRIIPQLTTQINSTTKLDNSIAIGKDAILVDISSRYLDVDSNVITQRSELTKEWSPTYKTYLGLDNRLDYTEVKINLPNSYSIGGVRNPFSVGEERSFTTGGTDFELGAYLRQEIKPHAQSKWTFLPNVRVDYFSTNEETHFQPRFQTRYLWDSSLLLRGSVGLYVQPPQPQESSKEYGNNKIRSPKSWHYTAGLTKDFRQGSSEGIEVTNNYFYKELNDLVIPDIQKNYNNSGTGRILGGEVQAKYRKNEWSSQLVYTYLDSERRIPGFGTASSEFDQTHNLNLICSYNLERWTYSARFRFVSGNPYTPVIGGTYDADNDVYIPQRGRIYSQRFDAFNQLDIRIDRKFIYDTWILTAYLDIQNFYNAKNPQSIQYAFDYSKSSRVRGLPILPTFGVKGEF